MKRKFRFLSLLVISFSLLANSARSSEFDVEDPLNFERARDLTLRGGLFYGEDIVGADIRASYGVNDIFVVGADVKYQQDFDNDRNWDGLSHLGLNMMYRMSKGIVTSDVFAGVKFAGNAVPEFSETIYSAGFRMGRGWDKITLAGLVKTSWIFDEINGMAWINLVPEAYFRVTNNWRIGTWADFQKVTDPNFDQTWLGLKVVHQYGRTQYVAFGQYEFNESEFRFGGRINVVF